MDPRLTGLDWKTSLSALLDLVLPRVCLVCGRPLLPRERHLCTECLADLPETHYATLARNPMADRFNARIRVEEYEPYAYAAALFHYRAEAGYKKIPQALKYHRNFGAGRDFARLLGGRLAASPLYTDVDLVVPVPLHRTRHWRRGYNQAAVIAREVARSLGASCAGRERGRRLFCTRRKRPGGRAHPAHRRRVHHRRHAGGLPRRPAARLRAAGAHIGRHAGRRRGMITGPGAGRRAGGRTSG